MPKKSRREMRIKYTGPLDKKLDQKIEKFAKRLLKFEEQGRGYYFEKQERDFTFYEVD